MSFLNAYCQQENTKMCDKRAMSLSFSSSLHVCLRKCTKYVPIVVNFSFHSRVCTVRSCMHACIVCGLKENDDPNIVKVESFS